MDVVVASNRTFCNLSGKETKQRKETKEFAATIAKATHKTTTTTDFFIRRVKSESYDSESNPQDDLYPTS